MKGRNIRRRVNKKSYKFRESKKSKWRVRHATDSPWRTRSRLPGRSSMSAMSRQVRYQLRHKRAGLCHDCSRPVNGGLFCEVHERKRKLRNRKWQRRKFQRKGIFQMRQGSAAPTGFIKIGTSQFQYRDLIGKTQTLTLDVYQKN